MCCFVVFFRARVSRSFDDDVIVLFDDLIVDVMLCCICVCE